MENTAFSLELAFVQKKIVVSRLACSIRCVIERFVGNASGCFWPAFMSHLYWFIKLFSKVRMGSATLQTSYLIQR